MPKLEAKYFKKMIAGSKGYLPSKVSKELKSAGMSSTLYNKVSKEQAAKAVRHLQSKGLMPKTNTASQLFSRAAKKQAIDQEALRQTKIQKHVQANIRIDIGEETSAEERGKHPVGYDPRSVLGKSLSDKINQEQEERDKKIQAEKGKLNKTDQTKSSNKPRASHIDLANLPDMDIG